MVWGRGVRLLLDTHALIWWLNENPRLTKPAHDAIGANENTVYVSIVTAWETAIKVGLGKRPEAAEILENF